MHSKHVLLKAVTRQYDKNPHMRAKISWTTPSMLSLSHFTSSLVQISQNLRWQFPYKTTLVAYIATYSLIGS